VLTKTAQCSHSLTSVVRIDVVINIKRQRVSDGSEPVGLSMFFLYQTISILIFDTPPNNHHHWNWNLIINLYERNVGEYRSNLRIVYNIEICCFIWIMLGYRTIIQCESKSIVPKTFCIIFVQAKHISVKICQSVANLSPHIFINFVRNLRIVYIEICPAS